MTSSSSSSSSSSFLSLSVLLDFSSIDVTYFSVSMMAFGESDAIFEGDAVAVVAAGIVVVDVVASEAFVVAGAAVGEVVVGEVFVGEVDRFPGQ